MIFHYSNTFSTKTFGGYIGNGNDLNLREPLEKNLGLSAEKSQEYFFPQK